MTDILTHATDAELAAAIEENLFALFRAIAQLPGSELVEGESLSYHDTSLPAPMSKGIWRTSLPERELDDAIEHMLDRFKARGSELVSWWFNDHPQPPDLVERLEAHDFELDYLAPGMALDLDRLDSFLRVPDGLTIVEAVDAPALADWTSALYGSFDGYLPMSAARIWADATLALGASVPWRMYVGFWNGQPAATNLVFDGAGVSGLFCIGTIPEARRKGIGAAITLKPLLDSRAKGYRYAVLFASEMGLPVYEKIGFRRVGIEIGRCVWARAHS